MTTRLLAFALFTLCSLPLRAQGPPTTPFVTRGACPFECCQLGDWTGRDSLPVYAQARGTAGPLFFVLPNEHFRADSADFYTLKLGIIEILRPMRLADHVSEESVPPLVTKADSVAYAALRRPLASGDTVYLIGHEPEVGEVVWFKGQRATVGTFWVQPGSHRLALAVLSRPIEHEWWVRITRNGRTGWIQAWGHHFDGADACG